MCDNKMHATQSSSGDMAMRYLAAGVMTGIAGVTESGDVGRDGSNGGIDW